MKKQTHVVFNNISNKAMSTLTSQVKETIAYSLLVPAPKKFTEAELWNIQQHTKARSIRRFL